MIMQTTNHFANIPTSGLVGIILDEGDRADEAMYYLLHRLFYLPLKRRYEVVHHYLLDDFDDILNDFFFFLRDGEQVGSGIDRQDNACGDDLRCGSSIAKWDAAEETAEKTTMDRPLYASLRRIRNREAFAQWLLHTFRNYLTVRASKEKPFARAVLDTDGLPDTDTNTDTVPDIRLDANANIDSGTYTGPSTVITVGARGNTRDSFGTSTAAHIYAEPSILTDERKLSLASRLIAYAHQKMPPRDSFILFRTLLTMLDKRQALPNEEMAEALGMTDISYRVTVHRVKNRLAQYRTRLLQGLTLCLDDPHQRMERHINDGFLHLYPTLLFYYNQIITTLDSNRADAIRYLRQTHLDSTGNLLHDPTTFYKVRFSKEALWNLLDRFIDG